MRITWLNALIVLGLVLSGLTGRGGEIHQAAAEGNLERVLALIERDPALLESEDDDGDRPLHMAAMTGQAKVALALLNKGAGVNAAGDKGGTPLHYAAAGGKLELVELLVRNGAAVNAPAASGMTPIHVAASQGRLEAIRFLISAGAEVASLNGEKSTPLHMAAAGGHTNVLALLLASGAKPDPVLDDDVSPLAAATIKGHPEIVRLLLQAGASPSKASVEGMGLMHMAVVSGGPEMVSLLMGRGLDINAISEEEGFTPLILAAGPRGRVEIVRLLLSKGAEVNVASKDGRTALFMAAGSGQVETVQLLLEQGADWALADSVGNTPLHIAAEKGQYATAKRLLGAGADPNATTRTGFKPVDLVRGKENDALARLLEEAMARGVAGGAPVSVGFLGDVRRINFKGNAAFSDRALRHGLELNVDFLLAAHPSADQGQYLQTVRRKLVEGYQHDGFPEVAVEVVLDEGGEGVTATIQEGPRYLKGAVVMEGARTIPVEAVLAQLTQRWPPRDHPQYDEAGEKIDSDPALWQEGEGHAYFDATAMRRMTARVEAALADHGFFFPKLALKVLPDAATGKAGLRIMIEDEGPPGRVGKVRVEGGEKNRPEEVLEYLDLKEGMSVDRARVRAAERKLREAARFSRFSVDLDRDANNAGAPVNLTVKVKDHPEAKALKEPWSREEETMLKLSRWLSSFPEQGEDLIASVSGLDWVEGFPSFVLVLSPREGFLLQSPAVEPRYAALLRDGRLTFHSFPGRLTVVAVIDAAFTAFVHALPDPESDSRNLSFGVGTLTRSQTAEAKAPFRLETLIAPLVMVSELTRDEEGVVWWEEGRMILTNDLTRMEVEAGSGRLVKWQLGSQTTAFTLRFDRGAMQEHAAGLAAAADGFVRFDAGTGFVRSSVAFALLELARAQAPDGTAAIAAMKARWKLWELIAGELGGISDGLFDSDEDGEDLFFSPADRQHAPEGALENLMARVVARLFRVSDGLFPKRSWPWTVTHEAIFVLEGNTTYTGKELERLFESPETGPVGFLAVSAVLDRAGQEASSRAFAARGLERLGVEEFRKDYRLFLAGGGGLQQSLERIATQLREWPEEEADLLIRAGTQPTSRLLRRCVVLLREHPDKPLHESLSLAWDEYWNSHLKGLVEEALGDLTRSE